MKMGETAKVICVIIMRYFLVSLKTIQTQRFR